MRVAHGERTHQDLIDGANRDRSAEESFRLFGRPAAVPQPISIIIRPLNLKAGQGSPLKIIDPNISGQRQHCPRGRIAEQRLECVVNTRVDLERCCPGWKGEVKAVHEPAPEEAKEMDDCRLGFS
jgi:hypothetical protein